MRPPANTPALLQSTSTAPNVSYAWSASAATSSNSADVGDERARPPSSVGDGLGERLALDVGRDDPHPSADETAATRARPIPLPAPVTTATLPWSCSIAASWQRICAERRERRTMSERIEKLVGELTLDEKAALVAGVDLWHGRASSGSGSRR